MGQSIGMVASGLSALSDRYEVITHNLANSSTSAFKRRTATFAQVMTEAQGDQPGGLQLQTVSQVDFSQGSMEKTDRPLDMAIEGDGFFTLETPDGVLYTRSGGFLVNAQGQLVDAAGRMVGGDAGPILIPSSTPGEQIRVSAQGEVYAGTTLAGRVKLVKFADPGVLRQEGEGLYAAPSQTRPDKSDARVHQGARELSNVNVVQELVDLITVSRLYEANFKAIAKQDERMQQILGVAMR